jgi:anti-sigma B factor antagonist
MTMNTREVGGVAVVDLIGRMAASDSDGMLIDRVARLMAEGHTRLVLNLKQLHYMDSRGLGEMVACYAKVRKAGGTIRLAETTHGIKDLLAITRLVTVFESYDTEALAVASFASAPAGA